jgi:predicted aspartyl protease
MFRITSKIVAVLFVFLAVLSCGEKKKKVVIPYVSYSSDTASDYGTIDIPYRLESGVKYVQVRINGLSTDMIIDTGCSMTLISVLEAQQLLKRGLLSKEDFLGTTESVIANGSVVEDAVFNIRTLELTDGNRTIVCRNVMTQVSSSTEAPVLLGNGVLDRVASYTVDNDAGVIRFKLK